MDFKPAAAALALLLGIAPAGAAPEATNAPPPLYNLLLEALAEECPRIADSISDEANLKALYQGRSMDKASICVCTMAGVRRDRKFREQLERPGVKALQQLRSPALTSYTSALLMRHSFACIADDIDSALEAYRFSP